MNNVKLTNEKLIKFYSHANEHYSISDLFMYKYKQEKRGYRELEAGFKNKDNISEADKDFFNSDLIEHMRNCVSLKYLIEPESGVYSPSQKWHLLISYYLYIELQKDRNIKSDTSNWALSGTTLDCPELCLWMVEAAMDGVIITSNDLYEMFYQAIEFKKNKKGHWKSFQWWEEHKNQYWDKITQIILRQEN